MIQNKQNWFYDGKEINSIEDFPVGCMGFIYRITNLINGKFYIGKKFLKKTTKQKIGKKELNKITGKGRRPSKKTIIKESDWQLYYGSCLGLKEDLNKLGKDNFKREIIKFCKNKKQLSFWEIYYLMINKVLEKSEDQCYNENIMGRYFKKDLI